MFGTTPMLHDGRPRAGPEARKTAATGPQGERTAGQNVIELSRLEHFA